MASRDEANLEERLGYRFRRPQLLVRALTHRSAAPEQRGATPGEASEEQAAEHNERLEFLGDAVLGLIASEALVQSFPGWSEGQLSRSRARLVNGHSLEAAARRLDLGGHLRLGKGEEKTGGREKSALLANAFEAVLAAIYLDGGIEPAREFLRRTLLGETLEGRGEGLAESDRKSALQEFLQGRGRPPAEYRTVGESGPDHQKQFMIEIWLNGERLAEGSGNTKKDAEQQAARQALVRLVASEARG